MLRISIELVRYANDLINVCNRRLAVKKLVICALNGPENAITSNFIYIYNVYNAYAHNSLDQGHECVLGTMTSFEEEQFCRYVIIDFSFFADLDGMKLCGEQSVPNLNCNLSNAAAYKKTYTLYSLTSLP